MIDRTKLLVVLSLTLLLSLTWIGQLQEETPTPNEPAKSTSLVTDPSPPTEISEALRQQAVDYPHDAWADKLVVAHRGETELTWQNPNTLLERRLVDSRFEQRPLVIQDRYTVENGKIVAQTQSAYTADRLLLVPREPSTQPLPSLPYRSETIANTGIVEIHLPAIAQLSEFDDILAQTQRLLESTHTVEPNFLAHAAATVPNDINFSQQSALQNNSRPRDAYAMSMPDAWDIRTEARGIVVAVIDSGIRLTHEDIRDNLWTNPNPNADGNSYRNDLHGFNAMNGSGDPSDDNGHGTFMAGLIGAKGNNSVGIAGVAWSVDLMALKFLDSEGVGEVSKALYCLDYAIDQHADIVNASWTIEEYSAALESSFKRVSAADIVIVCAAGNDGVSLDTSPRYPASFNLRNSIVVGANAYQTLATYSNYGSKSVDIFAPGEGGGPTHLADDSYYFSLEGTSLSAAHVSGLAALLRAEFPEASASEIIDRILDSAVLQEWAFEKGQIAGTANGYRALAGETNVPANDLFANAQPLATNGEPVTGQLGSSKAEASENLPAAAKAPHGTVWYRWTAPRSGLARFAFTPARYGAALQIFTGTSLQNLKRVASLKSAADVPLEGSFQTLADTNYWIQVSRAESRGSSFSLLAAMAPQNDDFESATPLGAGTISATGSTYFARRQADEPRASVAAAGTSVWYRFTSEAAGSYAIDFSQESAGAQIAVFPANANLANLSALPLQRQQGRSNRFLFTVQANTDYYLLVDSTATAGLSFSFRGAPLTSPTLLSQPSDTSVYQNSRLELSAQFAGALGATFQWYRNGEPIPGKTSPQLLIEKVTPADVGEYTLHVTLGNLTTQTRPFNVSITQPRVAIVEQPVTQRLKAGSELSLSVLGYSQGSFTYQWYKDGAAISGATTRKFVIPQAQTTDSGSYTVRLKIGSFETLSKPAAVVVAAQPLASDSMPLPPELRRQVSNWPDITYQNGRYLKQTTYPFPNRTEIQESLDGLNWINRGWLPDYPIDPQNTNPGGLATLAEAQGNGLTVRLIGTGSLGSFNRSTIDSLVYSSDGVNWQTGTWEQEEPPFNRVYDLRFVGNRFLLQSELTIWSSTNGRDWQSHSRSLGQIEELAFGGNTFVARSENGIYFASSDGLNWERTVEMLGNNEFKEAGEKRLVYFKDRFFAIREGKLLESLDGRSWTNGSTQLQQAKPINLIVGKDSMLIETESGISIVGAEKKQTPVIYLENTLSGSTVVVGSRISMRIRVIKRDTPIANVRVFENGTLIDEFTSTTIDYVYTPLQLGQNRVTFVATDTQGLSSEVSLELAAEQYSNFGASAPATPANIVYFKDRLYYAGSGGKVFSSDDGRYWRVAQVPFGGQIEFLRANENALVGYARDAGIIVSSDGQNWIFHAGIKPNWGLPYRKETPFFSALSARWGDNQLVSADGFSWYFQRDGSSYNAVPTLTLQDNKPYWDQLIQNQTERPGYPTTTIPQNYQILAFYDQRAIALSNNALYITSDLGSTWARLTLLDSIAAEEAYLTASAAGSTFFIRSTNGGLRALVRHSNAIVAASDERIDDVLYFDGQFYCFTDSGAFKSENGRDWQPIAALANYVFGSYLRSTSNPKGVFAALDNGYVFSTDGITWTEVVSNNSDTVSEMQLGPNGQPMAWINDSLRYRYSLLNENGEWGPTQILPGHKFAFGAERFVGYDIFNDRKIILVLDQNGNRIAETDLTDWLPQGFSFHRIDFGGGYFVMSSGNNLIYSANGIEWTLTTQRFTGQGLVEFKGKRYSAYSDSPNPSDPWVNLSSVVGTRLQATENLLLSIVSETEVALSSDGSTWETIQVPMALRFATLASDGKRFYIAEGAQFGGDTDDWIWISENGRNWRRHLRVPGAQMAQVGNRVFLFSRFWSTSSIAEISSVELIVSDLQIDRREAKIGDTLSFEVSLFNGGLEPINIAGLPAQILLSEQANNWTGLDLPIVKTNPVALPARTIAPGESTRLSLQTKILPNSQSGNYHFAFSIPKSALPKDVNPNNNRAFETNGPSVSITSATLGITVVGQGSIDASSPLDRIALGDRLKLYPKPETGFFLKSVTGNVTKQGDFYTVLMNGSPAIVATFERQRLPLKLLPTHGGTVAYQGQLSALYGDSIELQAAPLPGWRLKRWGDYQADPSDSLSVVMNGEIQIQAIFETSYELWKNARFNAEEILDPQISGKSADPNGNGIVNAMEYLMGFPADAETTEPGLALALENQTLTLTFRRVKQAADYQLVCQTSNDLTNWTTESATETILSDHGTYQLIEAQLNLSTQPARFLRLAAIPIPSDSQ